MRFDRILTVCQTVLFNAGQTAETVGVSIPGGTIFGFFLANGGNTYYTQSGINTADTGIEHFAVFRNSAANGNN